MVHVNVIEEGKGDEEDWVEGQRGDGGEPGSAEGERCSKEEDSCEHAGDG